MNSNLKGQILELLKSDKRLIFIYQELEGCLFKIERTECFTGTKIWNSTWAVITILCNNMETFRNIEKAKIIIEDILSKNYELGENYYQAKYIPRVEIKLSSELFIPNIDLKSNFENLKEKIIIQLKEAKYFIWVAMSWLTNKEIISILNEKAHEGINVQIIVNDDEINSKYFSYFLKNMNMQLYKVQPQGVYKNIMHHKFCVIDGRKVINGSYNWTNKAEYNNENINIINQPLVESGETMKYMDEFMKLKKQLLLDI